MRSEAAEPGGGHWGQVPLHFLYLGKKCPFSGMKVPYFHRIEVPFLQNLSALFGQCPLTFEVLPRPLLVRLFFPHITTFFSTKFLNFTSFKSFFPGIWFSLTRLKFSLLRKLYFQKADIFSFLVYINYSTTCVNARKYLRGNTVKCLCQAILTHYKSFLTFE